MVIRQVFAFAYSQVEINYTVIHLFILSLCQKAEQTSSAQIGLRANVTFKDGYTRQLNHTVSDYLKPYLTECCNFTILYITPDVSQAIFHRGGICSLAVVYFSSHPWLCNEARPQGLSHHRGPLLSSRSKCPRKRTQSYEEESERERE